MIHVEGNLNVQNYHDQSVTVAAQTNNQTNTQVNVQPQVAASQPETSNRTPDDKPQVIFNDKRGNRINIYRVIEAMRIHGFFKDPNGGQAKQSEVFAAFGQMLGDDFSEYARDLSQGKLHNADSTVSGDIFDTLKKKFLQSIEK